MSENTRKRNQPFISLEIQGKYNDFTDFYDENKKIIYESIFDIFTELKTTRKKSLDLYVSAKIKTLDWDTKFIFHKQEAIVLTRDLMPFFEDTEDYEKCAEIKKLYEELTNKKEKVII